MPQILVDPEMALPAGAQFLLGSLRWRCAKRPRCVAASADGTWLAVASDCQLIDLADLRTGKPLRTLHAGKCTTRALSFRPGSLELACGTTEGPILVFDVVSGERVTALRRFRRPVECLCWAQQGQVLLVGSEPGNVVAWRMRDRRILYDRRYTSNCFERTLTVSPCGQYAVAYQVEGIVPPGPKCWACIWDACGGQILWRGVLPFDWVRCAAGRDGRCMYILGQRKGNAAIELWVMDWTTGAMDRLAGPLPWVDTMAMSPSGACLALGASDGKVVLVNLRSGALREIQALPAAVERLEWVPNEELLVALSRDRIVNVLRVDGATTPEPVEGHRGYVDKVRWMGNSRRLVSASAEDSTVRIWDLDERKELSRWREKAEWYVCSASGRYLGVLHRSDVKQIIDLMANAVSATLPRDQYRCRKILFTPDESRVVLVEDSPLVARVIGIEGRELVGRRPLSHPGFVTPELPDAVRHAHAAIVGSCLVVAFDAGIGTYDLSTLHLVHWIPWQGKPVEGIVTDKVGRTIVLETEHAILVAEAWELGHARVLSVAGCPLQLSPDGRRLLVLVDGRCVVWDIEADKAASPFMSHTGEVLSATFSPDGTQVVTGGEEGLIICWQLDG